MSMDDAGCLYQSLMAECVQNINYFKEDNEKKYGELIEGLRLLETEVKKVVPVVQQLRALGMTHDFRDVPANGYRSYVKVADRFCQICLDMVANVTKSRQSIFFKNKKNTISINCCAETFAALSICLHMVQRIHQITSEQSLFVKEPEKIDQLEEFMKQVDVKNFYGRFIGFQYCKSVQSAMRMIGVLMATFAQYYYYDKNLFQCFTTISNRYMRNPELRGEHMAQITSYRTVSTDFCKHFWHLSDNAILSKMRKLIEPKNSVNQVFEIPSETFEYHSNHGVVVVPAPTVHIGPKATRVRLYSSVRRQGMEYLKKKSNPRAHWKAPSDWLILHIHGGGFVAQTSASHPYLASWSKWTNNTPILSIDYSLAPEAPYPRALDEVVHVYVWVLNNYRHLGTNAKRIVFAGDSAGGNLCLGLALKCIQMNLRVPDGIFCAYIPTLLRFYPSPSRFLSFMDPALPFGFLGCVLKAYTLITDESPNTPGLTKNTENGGNIDPDKIVSENERHSQSIEGCSSSGVCNGNKNGRFKRAVQNMIQNTRQDQFEKDKTDTKRINPKGVPEFAHYTSISQILAVTHDTPFMSPASVEDSWLSKMPPLSILTVEMDLCLDDCVLMAKRLDKLDKKIHLDVLPGLNHGFINFSMISKDAHKGSMKCAQRIKELLEGESHKEFELVQK